jgi:hypothetical protein
VQCHWSFGAVPPETLRTNEQAVCMSSFVMLRRAGSTLILMPTKLMNSVYQSSTLISNIVSNGLGEAVGVYAKRFMVISADVLVLVRVCRGHSAVSIDRRLSNNRYLDLDSCARDKSLAIFSEPARLPPAQGCCWNTVELTRQDPSQRLRATNIP